MLLEIGLAEQRADGGAWGVTDGPVPVPQQRGTGKHQQGRGR